MFSIEPVRHSFLGIDEVDNPICVYFLAGGKYDQLVELWHLKKEGVETKSFYRINFGAFSIK